MCQIYSNVAWSTNPLPMIPMAVSAVLMNIFSISTGGPCISRVYMTSQIWFVWSSKAWLPHYRLFTIIYPLVPLVPKLWWTKEINTKILSYHWKLWTIYTRLPNIFHQPTPKNWKIPWHFAWPLPGSRSPRHETTWDLRLPGALARLRQLAHGYLNEHL